MDRGSFSNSRRARHFGRTYQSVQSSPSSADFYGSPGFYGGSPIPFMRSPLPRMTRETSISPAFFDDVKSSCLPLPLAGLNLDENNNHVKRRTTPSCDDRSDSISKYMQATRLLSLPAWALDENHEIRNDLTLKRVVHEDLILSFCMDKAGCHFLQSNYFGGNTMDAGIRRRINREVLGSKDIFLTICKSGFGNFFMQCVIEHSNHTEQEIIKKYIISDIKALCLDKSACRVVQTALEKLHCGDAIVAAIASKNWLMAICTDRNANHIMQKIIKKFSPSRWEFLVSFFIKNDQENILYICRDKYGCRVVQTIVEVLSIETDNQIEANEKARVLRRLMSKILTKCPTLAHNEFANYIIQHIIETPGILSKYRDTIIETCLLRNLLSMSQEKYASHVIERAFVYAPLSLIAEMMDEIFDGYIPHPETGKDALDILLFHQFGNYVVQRMLKTCIDAVTGQRDTLDEVNYSKRFENWFNKLYVRVRREKARLMRFSSGKKMLEILQGMENSYHFPYGDSPSASTNGDRLSFGSYYEFDFKDSNFPVL
ncbi:hypothetical protein L3Y34_018369 [Caenorhabditis briggsae]|uniref:PUM-HD domain-containing protein n=1 Tax=Caenorhabditis briggsae TaxID=6238 RepID=A0AAE9IUJ1_CAEBR|nr:hypothetical protein L3Y34_018369 [Caenorhabditis briggsae]